MRHFLTLKDLTADELQQLIARAIELKRLHKAGEVYEPLKNKVLAMIFDKSSTRTRVSFESAMIQFGGGSIFLSPNDTQLGRGEPVEDSARVISSMVDAVMIRTFDHDMVKKFAENSSVPVINALTDDYHPCQLLADVLTYFENKRAIPLVLDNLDIEIKPANLRKDLIPVYSFNGDGLWLAKARGDGKRVGNASRLSLWEELAARMASQN